MIYSTATQAVEKDFRDAVEVENELFTEELSSMSDWLKNMCTRSSLKWKNVNRAIDSITEKSTRGDLREW